ncbi:MAG TPA: response regulator [Syntrophales bacterium]|nr:response regulator [Syntrophales bacterium]
MSAFHKHVDTSASTTPLDLTNKRIIVIEDFLSFRMTLRNMLRTFNCTSIDEAENGEEAIRKMADKRYDIILCDYNLGPGKDGQQVLEEARFREFMSPSSVFVMITAENTMDMFMGVMEYNPDDYLIKPFTKEALGKKLRDLVRKKENLKDIEKAIEKQEYTTVIELCDELIDSNVKNLSELLKMKGEFLIKKTSYDAAEAFYEKVLTMGNLPWAMLGLGRVKFSKGHFEDAKTIFENLIAKNGKLAAAYDWLAKTHDKMGNPAEAQQTLMQAVRVSPKAILRQKSLGRLAYKNKDLPTAERAFKETIKQGRFSIYKDPADYTTLAKVFVDGGLPGQGLNVLKDANQEFPNDTGAAVQISATECIVYHEMRKPKEAKQAAEKAAKAALEIEEHKIPTDAKLDLAKAYFLTGEEDKGIAVVSHLVQNDHEDKEVIERVRNVFKDLHMDEKGSRIINAARDEVIKLNNEGVKLVREGNLDKAVGYFKKAALTLPGNKIINANAAYSLILYMKKYGSENSYMEEAGEYLGRVKQIDPSYRDLPKLQEIYSELTAVA